MIGNPYLRAIVPRTTFSVLKRLKKSIAENVSDFIGDVFAHSGLKQREAKKGSGDEIPGRVSGRQP